jgi:hypothetical protein
MKGHSAASGIRPGDTDKEPITHKLPTMSAGSNAEGGTYLESFTSMASAIASYMRLPLLASSVR